MQCLRILTKKYWFKGKKRFYKYVYLKKLVGSVPQKVAWYAFTKRDVIKYMNMFRISSEYVMQWF